MPENEPLLELRIHFLKRDISVLRTVMRHGGLFNRILWWCEADYLV
jgi:hypothetical protein